MPTQPVRGSSAGSGKRGELRLERLVGVLGAGRDPARGVANGDPRHDRSPFWNFFTTFTAADGLRLPNVAPLIIIAGASEQQPRHETVSMLNIRSGVVSPFGNAEVLLDRLAQLDRAADVARRAVADAQQELADRLQPELRVEGRDAVDVGERDARDPVDLVEPLAAQVAVLGLRLLQQRDQASFLAHEVLVLEVVPPMSLHKGSGWVRAPHR